MVMLMVKVVGGTMFMFIMLEGSTESLGWWS